MLVLSGPPVVLSPVDIRTITKNSADCPESPIVLQGNLHVLAASDTIEDDLIYRIIQKSKERHFLNVIAWSADRLPPDERFGEPGDVWVLESRATVHLCQKDHTWALQPAGTMMKFLTPHPLFPATALAFNGTTIRWLRESARYNARQKLQPFLGEIHEPQIISAIFRKIDTIVATPQYSNAPIFPSASVVHQLPAHKQQSPFISVDDFVRTLRCHSSKSTSPQPATYSGPPSGDAETFSDTRASVSIEQRSSLSATQPLLIGSAAELESRETYTWTSLNGVTTLLPYAIEEPENGREDADVEWVRWAAQSSNDASQPLPGNAPPIVCVVRMSSSRPDSEERKRIAAQVRSILKDGRCVCIEPCNLQALYEWDEDTFARMGGQSNTSRVWHDAARRRDARRPGAILGDIFEQGTIVEFFETAKDPTKCINLLEVPLFHGEIPWIIEEIADDLRALRSTQNIGFVSSNSLTEPTAVDKTGPANMPTDLNKFMSWALATTAGFLTHVHHDANGAATWISVGSGAKIWTLLTPRNVEGTALLENMQTAVCQHERIHPGTLQDHFYVSSILLRPGSLFIQPPGQLHMVYTPTKTIAIGGHFLCYDTMHQTLLTRNLEFVTVHGGTNASHPAVDRLLSRMALSFSTLPKGTHMEKTHLLALFNLVLQSATMYFSSPEEQIEHEEQVGRKRKRKAAESSHPAINSDPSKMNKNHRERLAALQQLRIVAHAKGIDLMTERCPIMWTLLYPHRVELPPLAPFPKVSPSDIKKIAKYSTEYERSMKACLDVLRHMSV